MVRSHLVPPAAKSSVSSAGTVPPRPTYSQTLNFYGVGQSHLVPRNCSQWSIGQSPAAPGTPACPSSSHLFPMPSFSWGAVVPLRPTCCQTFKFYEMGRSHLVPPAPKPSVFMRWDGPTSSHLLPNPQFSWGGTTPPRPACSQALNFQRVGRSHLVPLAANPSSFLG